jgi:anti-sigma B factor antagonist
MADPNDPTPTPPPGTPRTVEASISEVEVEVEVMGQTVVATLTVTELAGDAGATRLSDLLYELGQCGTRHVVLDIQNVQFMDSGCLGCLVEALNMMSSSGGKIALANADHSVKSLFRLTRLDRVFPIAKDVMSALVAVEGKPEE